MRTPGISIIWLFLSLVAVLDAAPVLHLHGSTTVQGALESKRAELETAVGRELEFSPTGSSVGLASLAAGKADLAMIAGPLEEVASKLNAKAPGTIKPEQFRATQVGRVKLAFIVNPRNQVRALNSAQLADILTGRIQNWKDVGGADSAIMVVSLQGGGSLIPDALLRGAPITPAARLLPNAPQIPVVVAQQPNAIGIISTVHVKGPTSFVQTDAEIFVPLFLVSKGEPKADEQKLIDAAKKLLRPAS